MAEAAAASVLGRDWDCGCGCGCGCGCWVAPLADMVFTNLICRLEGFFGR